MPSAIIRIRWLAIRSNPISIDDLDMPPYQAVCSSVIRNNPFFFLSIAHFSHQAFIFSLLFALPTLTVGMILSIRSAQQNIVNSLKLLCSLYGTPKQFASLVLPLCGTSSAIEYRDFQFSLCKTVCTEGDSVKRLFGGR